jgi:hypothetical protein
MHHRNRFKKLGTAAVITVAVLFASQGASGAAGLSLKGAAGRYNVNTFQPLGNSGDAQASWTNKTAATGKFSMQLIKATNDRYAYAAAIVKGTERMTVAALGDIAFSFKGDCAGGSPRFNLYYDNDGNGTADGVAFYGCNNVTLTTPVAGWSRATFDASVAPFEYNFTTGLPSMTDASTVVQLSVLIDIVGTVNVDDVAAGGLSTGEPSS